MCNFVAMKFADKLNRLFLKSTLGVMGRLPLGMLYPLADALAWLAGSVVGYRRRVVRKNLQSSFPDKSEKELRDIERRYYRFLADYFIETVHISGMSRKEMLRRMDLRGMEQIDADLKRGRHVSIYLGHYCNWEWVSSIPLHLTAESARGEVYHPLENAGFDSYFLDLREKFGAQCVSMRDILRWLLGNQREGLPTLVGYIADQVPSYDAVHCFVDFMHQDTPVFTGAEKLSRRLKASAYYLDLRREKRGHYVGVFEKITDDASSLPEFELTREYFRRLQKSIQRQPELWLWSHNRWKRTREGFFEKFGDKEARERLEKL